MANTKEYFSGKAADWNVLPEHQKRSETMAEFIRDKVKLHPSRTEALDFGCGTGQLALLLQKHVRKIMAVDAAPGMIEQLRSGIRAANVQNIEAKVLDITQETRLLPREGFDFVYSQMVLHHIEGYLKVVAELKRLLKPEGILCLVDLDREDGSFHSGDMFIPHRGFVREELERQLERLGFFDVEFFSPYTIKKKDASGKERAYPLFMALAYNAPQPV